jgi:hypothetical protein
MMWFVGWLVMAILLAPMIGLWLKRRTEGMDEYGEFRE